MIELASGKISFPELAVTIQPLISIEQFLSSFPEGHSHTIKDDASGSLWYGAKEKIYDEDCKIPIWLCFDRENRLESVELYPQFGDNENMVGFPMDAEDSEQKYCAAWLQRFCGLTWENSGFSWGTIHTDYDPRSDSCGIVIRYTRESTDREER